MRMQLIAVGKLKERYWREACAEYLKRLQAYGGLEVVEVPDVDPGRGGVAHALDREGRTVLDRLKPDDWVVLCDGAGTARSSPQLAARLEDWTREVRGRLVFIIGGSHGASDAVRARADETLSFGPLTLPHNLARVVLLEQIYRAWRISRHEPYHK